MNLKRCHVIVRHGLKTVYINNHSSIRRLTEKTALHTKRTEADVTLHDMNGE